MGTAVLACPRVRANGIAAVMFGAGLNPPPPAGTIPPPPPLGVAPVEVYEEIDLVYLYILSVVTLGSWSQFLVLIRLTSKILSVGTSCSNCLVNFSL